MKSFLFDITARARFGVTIEADSLEDARAELIRQALSDDTEHLTDRLSEQVMDYDIGASVLSEERDESDLELVIAPISITNGYVKN